MSIKEKKSTKLKQHQNGHLSPFKFAKLLDPEADWDKDQLGDVLHWIRQIVALVCGLLWGAFPLVGGIWIVAFLLISSGIIYGYYTIILQVDEEEFGGHGLLLQEGLFASFTLFLLGLDPSIQLGILLMFQDCDTCRVVGTPHLQNLGICLHDM
ncbi:putative rab5-interacting protein family [Helianthus annuus]|uniref:Rab5-interacting protein family n=1 Tax=Helianthus annuus TaxID=4232 RepID=A0A9K3NS13_HELAN|nr:respirasome Complex Assembly Factor 1 [Helianthus annuus]KAF5809810.1 putative rab5-interacting protein family [Helianthus annuus]KAJ0926501.1 putative rab5-interacting protein family [Helianthus annuus]